MIELNKIYNMDCLDGMKLIPDNSVDMILCDLPYGTTACSWDAIIPFESLWEQYKRMIKNNGAIILTAREPFTSKLICSNIKEYKHKWIWNKKQSGSAINGKYMPHQIDEDIIVFCNGKVNYVPIMRKGKMRKRGGYSKANRIMEGGGLKNGFVSYSDEYYPINILDSFTNANRNNKLHPTQKPVALFEYLIKTYSNEKDIVLDNCMGSGTTAVACKHLNRNFIGFEISKEYCEIANNRLKQNTLFDFENEDKDLTGFGL